MPDSPKPKPPRTERSAPGLKPNHPGLMIGGVVVLQKNQQIRPGEFGRRVEKAATNFFKKRKRERGE